MSLTLAIDSITEHRSIKVFKYKSFKFCLFLTCHIQFSGIVGRPEKQKQLVGHTMKTKRVKTQAECFMMCKKTLGCVSMNACKDPTTDDGVLCDLNDAVGSEIETNKSCVYYMLDVGNCGQT